MSLIRKHAFWILLSYIALYWASDYVLGTSGNRNLVDWMNIIVGSILAASLIPDAADRFMRGGEQRNWQTLMSYVGVVGGWVLFCIMTLLTRPYGEMSPPQAVPNWMGQLTGFFKAIMLGSAIIGLFGTSDQPMKVPAHRLWYIAVGTAGGILMGIALAKLFM